MQETQDPRLIQAQQAAQAAQGLGTPPPAPYEYTPNSNFEKGKALIDQHIDKQQMDLAAKAQAQQEQKGYAGYRGDQTAGVQTGNPQQGEDMTHPNMGWSPSSQEAHNLNIQLADRIKSGSIDPQTAMLALQHNDVSPEIKQALSVIVQQSQNGVGAQGQDQSQAGMQEEQPAAGLGSVGIPQ